MRNLLIVAAFLSLTFSGLANARSSVHFDFSFVDYGFCPYDDCYVVERVRARPYRYYPRYYRCPRPYARRVYYYQPVEEYYYYVPPRRRCYYDFDDYYW